MNRTVPFILLCLFAPSAAGAEITIEEIIENVKRNEALYEHHDVRLKTEYEYAMGDVRPPGKIQNTPDGPVVAEEIAAMSLDTHYVSQDGLFRLDRAGSHQVPSGTRSSDRIRAFDGTTTRVYDQKAVGNIIQGRQDDEDAIRPHTLFVRNVIKVPLSTLLSGDEALRAHPFGNWREGMRKECEYHGEETVDGLKCHQVWFTESFQDVANNRWEFWLAEERNYIPVRMRSFTFRHSKHIPDGQATVSEWREIEPGVWFPFEAQVTVYDHGLLQVRGEVKVHYRYRYFVESASLHPSYAASFFHDVVFPSGTAVYEVENGQVRKAYGAGSPESPTGPAVATGINRWLLGITLAAALALVLWVGLRSRRRQRTGS